MFLVDTNVWLERLLDQARSAEVGQFLDAIASNELLISDFTLHSIGIILDRLGQRSTLPQFVDDLFVDGEVTLVSVPPQAMGRLVSQMDRFNLDFDDAYQYVAAEQSDSVIVSFDGDFDRTDRGRQAPADALAASQGAER
jgi:predicted nucleic acid-binding protein